MKVVSRATVLAAVLVMVSLAGCTVRAESLIVEADWTVCWAGILRLNDENKTVSGCGAYRLEAWVRGAVFTKTRGTYPVCVLLRSDDRILAQDCATDLRRTVELTYQ